MERDQHPVWAVYDKLRTARLNVKYYSTRLDKHEQWNRCMEIILLVSAPSSAIAGIWFFKTDVGKYVWQILGVVSAIVATVRPAFQMTRKIKAYEATIQAYRVLEYDLEMVRRKIELRGTYDDKLKNEFLKAIERQKQADGSSPEHVVNEKTRDRCTAAVLAEMPAHSFFVPEA